LLSLLLLLDRRGERVDFDRLGSHLRLTEAEALRLGWLRSLRRLRLPEQGARRLGLTEERHDEGLRIGASCRGELSFSFS
jgi:hypothetical protein